MLQPENLFLALAIVAGSCLWYRAGFQTPTVLRLPVRVTRQLIIAVGWTLLIGIAAKSVGSVFAGRIPITQTGVYAWRAQEPQRFWAHIAGELIVVGGTGALLIGLGRSRPARGVAGRG